MSIYILYIYVLFPNGEERASKHRPGGTRKESPNPRATRLGAKRGIALIGNQKFNAPRGKRDLKFKREIQV